MTAIEFENISKQYRLGLVNTGTIAHDINRWWQTAVLRREDPYLKIGEVNDRSTRGTSEYVWALRDINFKVEQGDVVGIIGKNGAGKSTLLKLLSKVTSPTTGTIRARGRIASLLEVGTGFHGEMTGRENIYLNGAIMGMTRQEIDRKFDEIVDFSGCERYIDTPVKRYSSGMTVRLGFAVAAHLDPEILVVDEVLAVGDAEFQKKAIGKMQDISHGDGRTVLFVSHNMASIRALCNSGILLNNGYIDYVGGIKDCVSKYIDNNIDELRDYIYITDQYRRKGYYKELEYIDIKMLNDVHEVATEEDLCFEMTVRRNDKDVKSCQFGIVIKDVNDIPVGTLYSHVVQFPVDGDLFKVKLVFSDHQLSKGKYKLIFNISYNDYQTTIKNYDIVYDVICFEITHIDAQHSHLFLNWPSLGGCAYRNAQVEIVNP